MVLRSLGVGTYKQLFLHFEFLEVPELEDRSTKSTNLTVGAESSMSFNRMEIYANTNIINAGTFSATDIKIHNGGSLNYTALGDSVLNLESLVVMDGAALDFSALQAASTFSMRDAAIHAITVGGDLVFEAGSVVTLNGVYVDGLDSIANTLTIEDGAIINVTGLEDLDGDGMVTIFTNFNIADDASTVATIVLNGVETQVNYADGTVKVSTASIPEPTTATLSLLALAALAARRRRF